MRTDSHSDVLLPDFVLVHCCISNLLCRIDLFTLKNVAKNSAVVIIFLLLFSAMEISYLQGGGRDPEILSQIKQLELEAKRLKPASTAGT